MQLPAFIKNRFRTSVSRNLQELLKDLEKKTLSALNDDQLLEVKFRIEADLESLKFRGMIFSILPVLISLITLSISKLDDILKYAILIVAGLLIILIICLIGNFITVHHAGTFFLKVIDDEILKRSKEKEEKKERVELRKERLKGRYSVKR